MDKTTHITVMLASTNLFAKSGWFKTHMSWHNLCRLHMYVVNNGYESDTHIKQSKLLRNTPAQH